VAGVEEARDSSKAERASLVCFVASSLDREPELVTTYGASLLAAALRMPALEGPYAIDLTTIVEMMLKRRCSPNSQKDSPFL
jgi:hypothetical protein